MAVEEKKNKRRVSEKMNSSQFIALEHLQVRTLTDVETLPHFQKETFP